MRRYKDLNNAEKRVAIKQAENEAMKLVMSGKAGIHKIVLSEGVQHLQELYKLMEPLTKQIAEDAYYPDPDDIVIHL